MRAIFPLFFAFFVIFTCSSARPLQQGARLGDESIFFGSLPAYYDMMLSQVLIRHGDRTPIRPQPPNASIEWWLPAGQLTVKGMRQQQSNGILLRQMYADGNFLNTSWDITQVHIRSSDIDRCLMSAQSLMFGMFPEGTGPVSPQTGHSIGDRFQPVPIHSVPVGEDMLLKSQDWCTSFINWLTDDLPKSQAFAEKEEAEKEFIERVRNVSGLSDLTLATWNAISDPITCAWAHDYRPMKGFTDADYMHLFNISDWVRLQQFPNDNMDVHKWISGNLATEFLKMMDQKIAGETSKKFILYSGHDTTIMSLLSALGLFDGKIPPYASHVIIEMFNDTRHGEYYARFVYNNKTLLFDKCSNVTGLCALDDLKAFISVFALSEVDWKLACGVPTGICEECRPNYYPPVWAAVVILVLGVVMIISWLLALIFFREKVRFKKKMVEMKEAYEPIEA